MLNIIGEATSQERSRSGRYNRLAEKDVILQETEPMRETRLVDMLKAGESANYESGAGERTRNRTKLEGGNITIETYSEDGRLLKISPPGYLPFSKTA